MIEVTDLAGRKHWYAATAIAGVSEPGPASAWHGARAFLRLFNGAVIEVREDADEIGRRIAAETARRTAPDAQNAAPGSGGGSGGETRSAGAGEEGRWATWCIGRA